MKINPRVKFKGFVILETFSYVLRKDNEKDILTDEKTDIYIKYFFFVFRKKKLFSIGISNEQWFNAELKEKTKKFRFEKERKTLFLNKLAISF